MTKSENQKDRLIALMKNVTSILGSAPDKHFIKKPLEASDLVADPLISITRSSYLLEPFATGGQNKRTSTFRIRIHKILRKDLATLELYLDEEITLLQEELADFDSRYNQQEWEYMAFEAQAQLSELEQNIFFKEFNVQLLEFN